MRKPKKRTERRTHLGGTIARMGMKLHSVLTERGFHLGELNFFDTTRLDAELKHLRSIRYGWFSPTWTQFAYARIYIDPRDKEPIVATPISFQIELGVLTYIGSQESRDGFDVGHLANNKWQLVRSGPVTQLKCVQRSDAPKATNPVGWSGFLLDPSFLESKFSLRCRRALPDMLIQLADESYETVEATLNTSMFKPFVKDMPITLRKMRKRGESGSSFRSFREPEDHDD